jgi:hypothetical protein
MNAGTIIEHVTPAISARVSVSEVFPQLTSSIDSLRRYQGSIEECALAQAALLLRSRAGGGGIHAINPNSRATQNVISRLRLT